MLDYSIDFIRVLLARFNFQIIVVVASFRDEEEVLEVFWMIISKLSKENRTRSQFK